jgi:hypothetical protein
MAYEDWNVTDDLILKTYSPLEGSKDINFTNTMKT